MSSPPLTTQTCLLSTGETIAVDSDRPICLDAEITNLLKDMHKLMKIPNRSKADKKEFKRLQALYCELCHHGFHPTLDPNRLKTNLRYDDDVRVLYYCCDRSVSHTSTWYPFHPQSKQSPAKLNHSPTKQESVMPPFKAARSSVEISSKQKGSGVKSGGNEKKKAATISQAGRAESTSVAEIIDLTTSSPENSPGGGYTTVRASTVSSNSLVAFSDAGEGKKEEEAQSGDEDATEEASQGLRKSHPDADSPLGEPGTKKKNCTYQQFSIQHTQTSQSRMRGHAAGPSPQWPKEMQAAGTAHTINSSGAKPAPPAAKSREATAVAEEVETPLRARGESVATMGSQHSGEGALVAALKIGNEGRKLDYEDRDKERRFQFQQQDLFHNDRQRDRDDRRHERDDRKHERTLVHEDTKHARNLDHSKFLAAVGQQQSQIVYNLHLVFEQPRNILGTEPGPKNWFFPRIMVPVLCKGQSNYFPPQEFEVIAQGYASDMGENTLLQLKVVENSTGREMSSKAAAKHMIDRDDWDKLSIATKDAIMAKNESRHYRGVYGPGA